ncbi:hypothetical protein [Planctomyces sp. SH-PL62]|uniref:hypothetical protein n=1 Tax=Planctomyces sp. SH-PL62 TaxID=1636152 RepID=UPI00078BA47C|nr:hypothetical protein [Planctomyces sp. SH-PL62]AMV37842.1 hypothetical protein VT85_10420 [Planctomyces sp. SH-PL62]
MIQFLEGGTDAAALLLFDPEALPDDFDDRTRDDPSGAIEEAVGLGRAFLLTTDGDGDFALGVCVGEGPPEELEAFLRPIGEVDRFPVVGGSLQFAGVEYAFRRDDAALAKHPHMGGSADVPPGVYRLRVHEADYPESFLEERMRGRSSAAGLRLLSLMNRRLLPLGSLGAIVGVVSLLFLGWRDWRATALPVCLAMVLPAVLVSRLRTYREARDAGREIARELPDYWAVLEPVEPA